MRFAEFRGHSALALGAIVQIGWCKTGRPTAERLCRNGSTVEGISIPRERSSCRCRWLRPGAVRADRMREVGFGRVMDERKSGPGWARSTRCSARTCRPGSIWSKRSLRQARGLARPWRAFWRNEWFEGLRKAWVEGIDRAASSDRRVREAGTRKRSTPLGWCSSAGTRAACRAVPSTRVDAAPVVARRRLGRHQVRIRATARWHQTQSSPLLAEDTGQLKTSQPVRKR